MYYLNPFLVDKDVQHRSCPSDHPSLSNENEETKSWAILLQLVARQELHNELTMKNALISALTEPWMSSFAIESDRLWVGEVLFT